MADRHDEAYDRGYNEGKNASWVDDFVHSRSYDLERGNNSRTAQSQHAGFIDGVTDKHDDSNSHYHGGSSKR